MDELFHHLISNDRSYNKTMPHMLRAFESKPLRQRTFFFSFKYYTTVAEGLSPAAWQTHDQRKTDAKPKLHIDISECSSIVALSLDDKPVRQVPARRARGGARTGVLYDPFGPFHVLAVQCFPDQVCVDHDFSGPCFSGPQAFLECLALEYKAAVMRLSQLHEQIMELTLPTVSVQVVLDRLHSLLA